MAPSSCKFNLVLAFIIHFSMPLFLVSCEPILQERLHDQSVKEGDSALFLCDVNDKNKIPISWVFSGTSGLQLNLTAGNSHKNSHDYEIAVVNATQTYKLVLENVRQSIHAGRYECGYHNIHGEFISLGSASLTINSRLARHYTLWYVGCSIIGIIGIVIIKVFYGKLRSKKHTLQTGADKTMEDTIITDIWSSASQGNDKELPSSATYLTNEVTRENASVYHISHGSNLCDNFELDIKSNNDGIDDSEDHRHLSKCVTEEAKTLDNSQNCGLPISKLVPRLPVKQGNNYNEENPALRLQDASSTYTPTPVIPDENLTSGNYANLPGLISSVKDDSEREMVDVQCSQNAANVSSHDEITYVNASSKRASDISEFFDKFKTRANSDGNISNCGEHSQSLKGDTEIPTKFDDCERRGLFFSRPTSFQSTGHCSYHDYHDYAEIPCACPPDFSRTFSTKNVTAAGDNYSSENYANLPRVTPLLSPDDSERKMVDVYCSQDTANTSGHPYITRLNPSLKHAELDCSEHYGLSPSASVSRKSAEDCNTSVYEEIPCLPDFSCTFMRPCEVPDENLISAHDAGLKAVTPEERNDTKRKEGDVKCFNISSGHRASSGKDEEYITMKAIKTTIYDHPPATSSGIGIKPEYLRSSSKNSRKSSENEENSSESHAKSIPSADETELRSSNDLSHLRDSIRLRTIVDPSFDIRPTSMDASRCSSELGMYVSMNELYDQN